MRHVRGWSEWEWRVNGELSLDATLASGSQFHDKGDGVDRSKDEYAYMVDAKYTEAGSYSVSGEKMRVYINQAARVGKKFALCLRIWTRGKTAPKDFAIIPFDDFVDLLEKARHWEKNA